jgi:hypothetical protein
MPIENITTDQLLTVGGISIVTWLLTSLIFRTAALSDALKDRFGAAIATVIGILLSFLATIILVGTTGDVLLQAFLTGLTGGLAAVGIHEVASNATTSGG